MLNREHIDEYLNSDWIEEEINAMSDYLTSRELTIAEGNLVLSRVLSIGSAVRVLEIEDKRAEEKEEEDDIDHEAFTAELEKIAKKFGISLKQYEIR